LNYLSHIFLSKNDSNIAIGNFIGDFVKGSQFNEFPERICKGIILHRKIDHFTDNHPVVTDTKAFIRPIFGRYSGIVLDMYFDYFLARNFNEYSKCKSLRFFAFKFYIAAVINYRYLPTRVKGFIFHFITTNRLEKYSTLEGLKRSLEIMAIHKVSAIKPDETIEFLIQNSFELEKQFKLFFPDLIEFVDKQLI
jgi:acyl carrier protein phosphodiesterase